MPRTQINVPLDTEHLQEIDAAVERLNRRRAENRKSHRSLIAVSRTAFIVDAALGVARSDAPETEKT